MGLDNWEGKLVDRDSVTGELGELTRRLEMALEALERSSSKSYQDAMLPLGYEVSMERIFATDSKTRVQVLISRIEEVRDSTRTQECFIVRGVRDAVGFHLKHRADSVASMNEKRRDMREQMIWSRDKPEEYRRSLTETSLAANDRFLSDEQIYDKMQDMLDSPICRDVDADEVATLWRGLSEWNRISDDYLADDILYQWFELHMRSKSWKLYRPSDGPSSFVEGLQREADKERGE